MQIITKLSEFENSLMNSTSLSNIIKTNGNWGEASLKLHTKLHNKRLAG